MNFLDTLTPGDKIDIHLVQQMRREDNQGLSAKLYKSNVMDYVSEKELEIGMPMDGGKMVLFQVGIRIDMIFYTKRGLYRCQAIVQKRYKRGNLFMLAILADTPLSKFQRREYFRIDCLVHMKYQIVTEEIAMLPSTREIFSEMQKTEQQPEELDANILDISGGGARFTTDVQIPDNSYIVCSFRLTNERIDDSFYLITQVIASKSINGHENKYMNRSKFLFKDLRDRESIVQFVFEEERRFRRREKR